MNEETKQRFSTLLDGFVILHADIVEKDNIVFIVKSIGGPNGYLRDSIDLPVRLIYYNPNTNKEKNGVGAREFKVGIRNAYVAFSNDKNTTIVSCSNMAMTYEILPTMEKPTNWEQIPTPENVDQSKLKIIFGCKAIDNELYMYGANRKLYKRTGIQSWRDLSYEDTHPNLFLDLDKKVNVNVGFKGVDGFNSNDIYGCGNNGDCWHYDGKSWQKVELPVDSELTSILCAGDGFVYIGLIHGDIVKGRLNENNSQDWKVIKGDSGKANSLAWFENHVYIGSDLGLYTIDSRSKIKKYQSAKSNWRQYSFKHVTSCKEALLVYGNDQAYVFDGTEWYEIIN